MTDEKQMWLEKRKKGIGGSDAAAILGMSPWKSPMSVWLDKMGLAPERPDPDKEFLMDLGHRLEPVIAGLYERETKEQLIIPSLGVFQSKRFPILLGTPDRFVLGKQIGVELKTENQYSDLFGEPGTDAVPDHYLIQCAHYMAVMEYDRWDVAVLHGGVRFSRYTIKRDLELEQNIIDHLLGWWEAHIKRGVPPDVDSSNAWRVYLHQKYPSELEPATELAPEHFDTMARLAQVRDAQRVVEALRDELENKLKSVIGNHEGVFSDLGKITWKKTRDSEVTDWQRAYWALRKNAVESLAGLGPEFKAPSEALDKLAGTCLNLMTTSKPGVRRFLFTPTKRGQHARRDNNIVEIGSRISAALPDWDAAPTGNNSLSVGSAGESSGGSPLRDGGKAST